MSAITLITGASGGIGEELAVCAANAGRELALVARSAERLSRVAERVAALGYKRPQTIALDLGEVGAADRLADALAQRNLTVSELVNNAGYGLVGPVARLARAQQVGIVDLNVRELTDLTILFLPQVIAARGGILNVASTAAFQPGPNMATYYASKSYVLSFSEALAYEMRKKIRVSVLCPGPVPTGFQKRANLGISRMSHLPGMPASRVAEIGWKGFEAGKRLVIPGLTNRITAFFGPRVPRAAVLAISAYLANNRRGK
jgi:short-subunit dehydrogenase